MKNTYIGRMKRIALITMLMASPLAAEETPPSEGSEGWNMLREGSRLLLEQLFEDMGPALEDLEGFVDDLNAYEAPEILPNGDILIRRKPDRPLTPPQEPGPEAMPPDAERSDDEAIDL
ncbi:AAA+ family ATPase [Celeribacter sp. ULVN23_4]